MHTIKENANHIILPITLAMHASVKDVDTATDGLNEMLRSAVDSNFIADYNLNTKGSTVIKSSDDPVEGELFSESLAINTQHLFPDPIQGESRFVWVVGCESLTSGSFDWFYNEVDARKMFETDKSYVLKIGKTQSHFFMFEVSAELDRDAITKEVDDYYNQHALTKNFNASKLVTCFPFTPDAWEHLVTEYQKEQ